MSFKDHLSRLYTYLLRTTKLINSVAIHHRHLQVLVLEMFTIHWGLSPDILRNILVPKISSNNLLRNNTFERPQVHSVYHCTYSLSFLSPKIWDLVPLELKQLENLEVFKLKIKIIDSFWMPLKTVSNLYTTNSVSLN